MQKPFSNVEHHIWPQINSLTYVHSDTAAVHRITAPHQLFLEKQEYWEPLLA